MYRRNNNMPFPLGFKQKPFSLRHMEELREGWKHCVTVSPAATRAHVLLRLVSGLCACVHRNICSLPWFLSLRSAFCYSRKIIPVSLKVTREPVGTEVVFTQYGCFSDRLIQLIIEIEERTTRHVNKRKTGSIYIW